MPSFGTRPSGESSLPLVTASSNPTTAGSTPCRATTASPCLLALGSDRGRCRCSDTAAGHRCECLPPAPPRSDPVAQDRPRENLETYLATAGQDGDLAPHVPFHVQAAYAEYLKCGGLGKTIREHSWFWSINPAVLKAEEAA